MADLLDRWGVFRARLFRESCVFHRGNYVKDLSRLGRELSKVIIVDNSPASYIFHPENAVSSPKAKGRSAPSELSCQAEPLLYLQAPVRGFLAFSLVKSQLCHLAIT